MTVLAAADVFRRDRVVHQRRQAAVALDRGPDRAGDLLLDAVVGAEVRRLPARRGDAGLHRATVVLGAAREHDRGALRREHLHDPLADAPGAPGDQRDLAVEPHDRSPCKSETKPYSFILGIVAHRAQGDDERGEDAG